MLTSGLQADHPTGAFFTNTDAAIDAGLSSIWFASESLIRLVNSRFPRSYVERVSIITRVLPLWPVWIYWRIRLESQIKPPLPLKKIEEWNTKVTELNGNTQEQLALISESLLVTAHIFKTKNSWIRTDALPNALWRDSAKYLAANGQRVNSVISA